MAKGRFTDDITSLLASHGISFTKEDSEAYSVLSAEKKGSAETVSVILIPLIAGTPDEARIQSEAIGSVPRGTDTIAISEDRWMKSRDMMANRLLAHTGIFRSVFARDCETRKISRHEADCFLEKTHSYGGAQSRYCYGLFLKRERVKNVGNRQDTGDRQDNSSAITAGTMVAAAEFSNARRWIKDGRTVRSYEWIRYASLPDVRISGGMGKILNRFIDDIHPDDIMSYADLEWSEGQAYRRLGFIEDGSKSPVTFRIDTGTWQRTPVKENAGTDGTAPAHTMYFQNFGSVKYRLKLY